MSDIHEFANGLRIRAQDLGRGRIYRYTKQGAVNLHEPVEESWFLGILETFSGGSFFDVGAAVGYYSILCKKTNPGTAVHAFDLLPAHRSAIAINLLENGLRKDDIHIHEEAIAPQSGEARFMEHSYGSSLLPENAESHAGYFQGYFERFHDLSAISENPNVKTTRAVSLNEAVRQWGRSPILVKMDVQGAEEPLIRSAVPLLEKSIVDYWIIGTHSPEIHENIHALMNAHTALDFCEFDVDDQPDGLIVARRRDAPAITPTETPPARS